MTTNTKKNLKIGCCGFRWSQQKYYSQFSLVEIQHTFYNPPGIKTLEKWRSEAPKNFEFTLKAYQLITHLGNSPTYRRVKKKVDDEALAECGHFQPTKTVFEAYDTTIRCAQALKAKHILFQCPARFTPEEENIENMRNFFSKVKRPAKMKFLWEPRGKWPEALVKNLCTELSLHHVVDPFKDVSVTQGLKYYRLHGRGRGDQKYKKAELKELALSVLPDEETYILFNNVYMVDDATAFQKLVC